MGIPRSMGMDAVRELQLVPGMRVLAWPKAFCTEAQGIALGPELPEALRLANGQLHPWRHG